MEMSFLLIIALAAFGILLNRAESSPAEPNCLGTKFIAGFLENYGSSKDTENLEIIVTTKSAGNVTVCVDVPLVPGVTEVCNWTTAGITTSFSVDKALSRLKGSAIESKGVLVTATENIIAYGSNRERYSNDAFLMLPVDSLGTDHYSIHAVPNFTQPTDYAEFVIVATEDDTAVDVFVSSLPNVSISFQGRMYGPKTEIHTILQIFQTLQLQSLADMTGTRIVTSRPVAFFSGNLKTKVLYDAEKGNSGDHLVEQIPPVSSWGTHFLVISIALRTAGDLIRIIGTVAGTVVTVAQNPPLTFPILYNVTVGEGEFIELDFPSSATHYVTATAPIALYQFCKTKDVDQTATDPFMMYVPPIDQYMNGYTFTTVVAEEPPDYNNHANIAVEVIHSQGLRLDGKALNQNKYTRLTAANGFVGIQLSLAKGTHHLSHVDNVNFGAFLYGQKKLESYGFPAGMKVLPINVKSTERRSSSVFMGLMLAGVFAVTASTLAATRTCCYVWAAWRRKAEEKEEKLYKVPELKKLAAAALRQQATGHTSKAVVTKHGQGGLGCAFSRKKTRIINVRSVNAI